MLFKNIKYFFKKITFPKSEKEDDIRKEFILNRLLISSIFLFTIATIANFINSFILSPSAYANNALSFQVIFLILIFFVSLFILSRKGFFCLASYILLSVFFLLTTYAGYQWGVDSHATLLFYILIIIMSGILISTRFAFVMLAGTVSALLILGYLQINNITHPNLFWKSASLGMTDIIMFLTIFIIITLVSWLSNREIEKLLKRAKKSERELKIERDSLEIKVAERTRELKETQMEKMTQIYRFAEFGWLSSGLFHDLINPLNAMSLNMEKVRCQDNNDSVVAETKMYLDKAIAISKRIENFVAAVRRQIARQGKAAIFSLAKEIEQVIEVLAHKAAKANVKIFFSTKAGDVKYFGDAIKFNQIVLNLVANAIDAYALVDPSAGKKRKRDVLVCLREEMGSIILSVEDYGAGIAEDNLNKIFEPFFSTKDSEGMGIGLSMAKRIIEKDFNGLVEVKSELHKGTIFIITIPNKLL